MKSNDFMWLGYLNGKMHPHLYRKPTLFVRQLQDEPDMSDLVPDNGFDFVSLGKHIARINISAILFASFVIVSVIDIEEVNKNINQAFKLSGFLESEVEELFKYSSEAIAAGSADPDALWVKRLGDRNLIKTQMAVVDLESWLQVFIDEEKNDSAKDKLYLVLFTLSSISNALQQTEVITGATCSKIDEGETALRTFLKDTKINTIKLPILNKDIQFSLLQLVVPIVELVFLIYLSVYVYYVSGVFKSRIQVNTFASQTVLFASGQEGNILRWLMLVLRYTPLIICLVSFYFIDLVNWWSWQLYALISVFIGFSLSLFKYERAIHTLEI